MQIYIDTNIYLEYFRENSSERLAPLRELVKLLNREKLSLLIPNQTKQEYFRRRREVAELTRDALKNRSKAKFIAPATIDQSATELKAVEANTKKLQKAYEKLLKKYDDAIEKQKTDADLLINTLMNDLGENLKDTDVIMKRAHERHMRGNPPRKNNNSYGDAIIWESLLEYGSKDNLAIISKDSDFIENHAGKEVLKDFLTVEWRIKSKKKKRATLYKSLAEFVNHFSKKNTIKKEVVEFEKERPGISDSFVSLSRGVVDYNPITMNSLVSDALSSTNRYNPFTTASTIGNFNLAALAKTVGFCPYCGSFAVTPAGAGKYSCATCGEFELN